MSGEEKEGIPKDETEKEKLIRLIKEAQIKLGEMYQTLDKEHASLDRKLHLSEDTRVQQEACERMKNEGRISEKDAETMMTEYREKGGRILMNEELEALQNQRSALDVKLDIISEMLEFLSELRAMRTGEKISCQNDIEAKIWDLETSVPKDVTNNIASAKAEILKEMIDALSALKEGIEGI